MASYNYNVTSAWASVQAGPLDLNVSNINGEMLYIATSASLPAETFVGQVVKPRHWVTVKIASGENLYVRSPGLSGTKKIAAVDVV